MADLIPPMLIQLQADVTQLKAGLAQAENALKGVDDSVKTASTGMTNFITQMKRVGATMGVAFAGQQIVQFGKDVIMAASDMNESLGKVSVVFGQSADEVVAWSKTSAQAMGLSSQKALEAAGTYGNLFQAFGLGQGQAKEMSTSLVQLASDMASFNNTSIDDAILALRSGLSGETEPLKRFGVALNDVRLKEQAMSMGLIKTATGPLPIAAKAQAAYALILHDTALAQGDYERTADGAANTMRTLAAEFQNAKVALGQALLPAFQAVLAVLKLLVPALTAIGKFFTENGDALKMYAIIVGTVVTGFYAIKTAITVTKTLMIAYTAVTKAMAAGHSLAAIATLNFRGAMMMLNAAMRANPVGVLITALTVLGAAFVYAWKKSETFRGIVIKGVQVILNGFASLVEGIGKFVGMLSKVPGMGWAKGIADGAKAASEAIKTTSKNLSDLKKSNAGYGEGAFTYGSGAGAGSDAGAGKGKGKGGLTTAEKNKLEGYKKDVLSIYKDMNKVIAKAQEDAVSELEQRNEKMLKAHKIYDEKVADLNKNYAEAMAEADKRYGEKKADEEKRRDKAIAEANKNYLETRIKIFADYADKAASLEKNLREKTDGILKQSAEKKLTIEKDYQKKIIELRNKAADKSTELIKSAADKQASIVKESIDRLREAFASKDLTESFNVSKLFSSGMSADTLLANLKKNLDAAKTLAKNAALLQAKGFSQTFIEQVVSAGPEVGNSLAESILQASPETVKELQNTFLAAESTATHGLDVIAQTMNSGGKLATEELMQSFNQVSVDLKEVLGQVNLELQDSLIEAQKLLIESLAEIDKTTTEAIADAIKTYDEGLAEAKKTRDENLADAEKNLTEALAQAKTNFDEAMADAMKTLTEAREAAQKNLSEGLAEAQKTLQEALLEAQKDYEKAIDEINKVTAVKLQDLKDKLKEIVDLINTINKLSNSGNTYKPPTFTPIVPDKSPGDTTDKTDTTTTTDGNKKDAKSTLIYNYYTDVTGVNLTDPATTAALIDNAIKYGNAVTVNNSTLNATTGYKDKMGIA